MKPLPLVLLALLALSCASTWSPDADHRERWLAENPDSPWRELVESRQVEPGMPRDAMFAAWDRGTWTWAGEAEDREGRAEWWRYELLRKDPHRPTGLVARTWRVRLRGDVVEKVFEPGDE